MKRQCSDVSLRFEAAVHKLVNLAIIFRPSDFRPKNSLNEFLEATTPKVLRLPLKAHSL